jgi:hypothetical protein
MITDAALKKTMKKSASFTGSSISISSIYFSAADGGEIPD